MIALSKRRHVAAHILLDPDCHRDDERFTLIHPLRGCNHHDSREKGGSLYSESSEKNFRDFRAFGVIF